MKVMSAFGFATVSVFAAAANAAYVQDFEAAGSQATDFTVIHSNNVNTTGTLPVISENTSGDQQMRVSTGKGSATTGDTQVRYIAAPTTDGVGRIELPTGTSVAPSRTEARLTFSLESYTIGAVNPFTAFGFAAFNADNTAVWQDKIIAQLNNDGDAVTLKAANNNSAVPGATLATLPLSGTTNAALSLPDTFQLEVTADQVRLLLNGTPLTSSTIGGAGNTDANGWVDQGIFTTDAANFSGTSLLPFFGVIRAASSFTTTNRATAAFDDISVSNVVVPEPTSLCMLGLGGMGLLARRRRA